MEFPEAGRAVASRFEGAFLSVARGARCSTPTSSGFFGLSSSCCLAGSKALFRSVSSCVNFRFVCCLVYFLFSATSCLCIFCHWYNNLTFYQKRKKIENSVVEKI